MGTWIAAEATSGTVSRNAASIFGSMSGWFRKKPLTTNALHDQVERVDRDRPSAHVRIDNEDPMLAERAADYGAALARNSVDGERHATVSDGCPDLVERAVFIHDHRRPAARE